MPSTEPGLVVAAQLGRRRLAVKDEDGEELGAAGDGRAEAVVVVQPQAVAEPQDVDLLLGHLGLP